MPYATFILSTGRCGTQWIARSLERAYADLIDVKHEPLHNEYDPRRMLSLSVDAAARLPDAVVAHIEGLARLERPYLECGHPCWSAIPYLLRRFPDRTRVIHLTRHPVPTCLSWLTQSAYEPPLLLHLEEKLLLSPSDAGVRFGGYQERWDGLSPYEKCLYYWSEVNALGIDTHEETQAPWLVLKYEDLFHGDGLEDLLDFLDLPARPGIFEDRAALDDDHRFVTMPGHDWRAIRRHPQAVAIAEQLGYDVFEVDEAALFRRYVEGQ